MTPATRGQETPRAVTPLSQGLGLQPIEFGLVEVKSGEVV